MPQKLVAYARRAKLYSVEMTDNLQASEYLSARGAKVRALLVDDQKIIAEAVKRMFADQPDISLFYCPAPAGAIDAAKNAAPPSYSKTS